MSTVPDIHWELWGHIAGLVHIETLDFPTLKGCAELIKFIPAWEWNSMNLYTMLPILI